MPKEFSRIQRVAELIRRELASVISDEMDDPRARFVSITAVDVSKDLRHAKVYVTQINITDKPNDVEFLQRAAGFLRKRIGQNLNLKNIPALNFIYDFSVERGADLSKLIEQNIPSKVEQE